MKTKTIDALDAIASIHPVKENFEVSAAIIEAFKKEPVFETDASLKDAVKNAGGKLRDRLMKFHHRSMQNHKQRIDDINRDPSDGAPGEHTYSKVMHGFHKARYESMMDKKPAPIHKTIHPDSIKPEKDRHGNEKPSASRAEQAAFQHHREMANKHALRYNKRVVKGKKDTSESRAIKEMHDQHSKSARSIKNIRSMPKAEKVKAKDTPDEAKKELKRAGFTGRKHSDEAKKKIGDASRARHEARKKAKAAEEKAAKRAAKTSKPSKPTKAVKPSKATKLPKGEEKLSKLKTSKTRTSKKK